MTDRIIAIQTRITEEQAKELDRLRAKDPGIPSRAEMARRLITGETKQVPFGGKRQSVKEDES